MLVLRLLFYLKYVTMQSIFNLPTATVEPWLFYFFNCCNVTVSLGAVHKKLRSQRGRGGCSLRTSGASSDTDSALFGFDKLRIFRNFWCVRTVKGCCASADILRTRREGVNLSKFCADVLYGRPHIVTTDG